MPIRPEMKARYPANWKEIRARILERAENKCEWCGVPNYAVGRYLEGIWVELHSGKATFAFARQVAADEQFSRDPDCEDGKFIVIVLTIAHVHDHSPENCADDNLAALCQRCHNRHDSPMRRRNAYMTRRKNGTKELPI